METSVFPRRPRTSLVQAGYRTVPLVTLGGWEKPGWPRVGLLSSYATNWARHCHGAIFPLHQLGKKLQVKADLPFSLGQVSDPVQYSRQPVDVSSCS